MPTIGASGFRFARRASALREVGAEALGAESSVLNAEPTGLNTLAEPPAERGEIEPTGQLKLEVSLASELQSASAEFAQFMRELSEGLTEFKLEKTSDPHRAADVWTDIVKSRSEAFLDDVPDAARPALRKRVDSLKLFHDFKVRDFERNQTRQNAFASIREARNDYVELVEADPEKLRFAKEEMDRFLDSSDLSVSAAQSQKAISDLALVRSYVRAGLNGDTPETLFDELKSGRVDALLTDEQKKELIGEVAAALERREREMRMAGQAVFDVIAQPNLGKSAPNGKRERTELERVRDSIEPRLVPTAGNPGNIRHIKEKVIDEPVNASDLPLSEKKSLKVSLALEAAWLDGEFEHEAGQGRAFLQRVDSGVYDGHFEGDEDAKRKFRDEYEAVLERDEQEAAAARQAKRDAHGAEQDELDAERAHLNDPLVHRWAADQIKADSSDQRPSASQPFLGEGGEHGHEARRRTRQRHWELLARHHRELAEHLPYLSAAWRQAQLSSAEEIEQILGDVRQRLGEDSVLLSGFKLLLKGRTQRLQHDSLQYARENSARLRELDRAANEETDPSMRAALRQTAIAFGKEEQARLTGSTEETRVLSLEDVAKEIGDLEGLTVTQQFDQLLAFLRERNWNRFGRQALGELLDGGLPPWLGGLVFLELTGPHDVAGPLRDAFEQSGVRNADHLDWTVFDAGGNTQILSLLDFETRPFRESLKENGLERDAELRYQLVQILTWWQMQKEGWVPSVDGEASPAFGSDAGRHEAIARWAIQRIFPFQIYDTSEFDLRDRAERIAVEYVSGTLLIPVSFIEKIHATLPASLPGNQSALFLSAHLWNKQNNLNGITMGVPLKHIQNDTGYSLEKSELKKQYIAHVREFGKWVNVRGGVQLVDGNGQPVIYADGSFVIVRWDDIPAMSGKFQVRNIGSSGHTKDDSSMIFHSDLENERELEGLSTLSTLTAPPEDVMLARGELILMSSPVAKNSILERKLDILENEQFEAVQVTLPDGTVETRFKRIDMIDPRDFSKHCNHSIGNYDQSIPLNYLNFECQLKEKENRLLYISSRANSLKLDIMHGANIVLNVFDPIIDVATNPTIPNMLITLDELLIERHYIQENERIEQRIELEIDRRYLLSKRSR